MDLFTISCETCLAQLSVHRAELIGQIHQCPRCGSMVLIQPPTSGADVPDGEPPADGARADSKDRWAMAPRPTEGIENTPNVEAIQREAGPHANGATAATASSDSPAPAPAGDDARTEEVPEDTHFAAAFPDALDSASGAVVGPLPDSAWASSGQNWLHGWVAYGVAAVVGIIGSMAVCAAVIVWNDGRRNVSSLSPSDPVNSVAADESVSSDELTEPQSTHELTGRPPDAEPTSPFSPAVPERESLGEDLTEQAVMSLASTDAISELPDDVPSFLRDAAVEEDAAVEAVEESTDGNNAPQLQEDPGHGPEESPTVASTPRSITPRKINLGAQLAVVIPAVDFDGGELQNCLRFLSDLTTVPISMQPEALLLARSSPSAPVHLQFEKHSVRDLLDKILRSHRLAYVVRDSQILITNRATDAAGLKQITYRIDDLLENKSHTAEQFAAMVTSLIAPGSWVDQGGSAVVVVEGDSLVIRQSGTAHWEVLQLCEKLRVARGLPVRSRYAADRFELTPRVEQAAPSLAAGVSLNYVPPTRLIEILDRLEEESGLQLLAHWLSMAKLDVYPDFETTFTATDQPLGQALDELLAPLGLAYRVVDRTMLQITSQEFLERHHEIEIHRVNDWPQNDATGEQLSAQVKKALDINQPASGDVHLLPKDRLIIARLSQPKQKKLVQYFMSRVSEKQLLDR